MKCSQQEKRACGLFLTVFIALTLISVPVWAHGNGNKCNALPTHAQLTQALKDALPVVAGGTSADSNGGLDLPMWATIVNERGQVCAVTFSGSDRRAQWQASRPISAQKAYTANSLTVTQAPGVFSTALLYTPTQPGQFLWGLHQSNPVNPKVVYAGPASKWGAPNDPMVGKIPGGVNTFGGGVSLWDDAGNVIGGLGNSGDTSCADHNIALRVRDNLVAMGIGLGHNPAGQYKDNIIYDIAGGVSLSGFGHPTCPGGAEVAVNENITGVPQNDPYDIWPY